MAGRSSRPAIVKRPTSAEPCIWSVKRRSNSESEARSTLDPTRSLATSQPVPNITTIRRTTTRVPASCLTRAMGSLQAYLVSGELLSKACQHRTARAAPGCPVPDSARTHPPAVPLLPQFLSHPRIGPPPHTPRRARQGLLRLSFGSDRQRASPAESHRPGHRRRYLHSSTQSTLERQAQWASRA